MQYLWCAIRIYKRLFLRILPKKNRSLFYASTKKNSSTATPPSFSCNFRSHEFSNTEGVNITVEICYYKYEFHIKEFLILKF